MGGRPDSRGQPMSDSKPTVDPSVVATAVDGAPDRVRRRLDRAPDAAAGWEWISDGKEWEIAAGNEIVKLAAGHIDSLDQVSCSCLLSPNCFHVMACLTALEVGGVSVIVAADQQPPSPDTDDTHDADKLLPSDTQQNAAANLIVSIDRLMNVGVSSAGVTVQSGLMRAVHQCRADGLHRASAIGLRVLEGTRQIRRRAQEGDPMQLAEDLTECIETAHHVASGEEIDSFWIGTARRKQNPVRPKRLHGLLAEPILTRSGYAGVAVYLLGENDQIYSVSDVRPGGADLCRGAYRGGIEIGPMVEAAHKLARHQYVTSEMTASRDGRLGRGKSVKIASQGTSDWDSQAIANRFQEALPVQWDRIYQQTNVPPDIRPAGWDFVFVRGSVIGIVGPELLIHLPREEMDVRLTITNDHQSLCFRENLRMLGHAPNLEIRLIGRLELNQPTAIEPLALVASDPEAAETGRQPRLDLPDRLQGRVNLGLDPIARHSLIDGEANPVVLGDAAQPARIDILDALRRRWVAIMLGGTSSAQRSVTNSIAAEITALDRSGFSTGAALLDAIARQGKNGGETFWATGIYLRQCTAEFARSQASLT